MRQTEADRMIYKLKKEKKQQLSLTGKCEKCQKYLQFSKYLTISHHFSHQTQISAPFAQFPSPKKNQTKTNPKFLTPSSTFCNISPPNLTLSWPDHPWPQPPHVLIYSVTTNSAQYITIFWLNSEYWCGSHSQAACMYYVYMYCLFRMIILPYAIFCFLI